MFLNIQVLSGNIKIESTLEKKILDYFREHEQTSVYSKRNQEEYKLLKQSNRAFK